MLSFYGLNLARAKRSICEKEVPRKKTTSYWKEFNWHLPIMN
jgi:hypothetical protein